MPTLTRPNAPVPGVVSTAAEPLARVRIVLVDTLEPANIGAAARAMKTMGLTRLTLVRPAQFPHGSACRLALSANDILDRAEVAATLKAAVAGCDQVYGVSARQRHIPLPPLLPREFATRALAAAAAADIAVVFGGEEAGLSNVDLMLCAELVQIPSDPHCRSLNLAAAVQLIAYELRLAWLDGDTRPRPPRTGAPIEAFEGLLAALDQALDDAGYYANKNRALANEKLRRMLQRATFDRGEIQMLRGVIAQLHAGTQRRAP